MKYLFGHPVSARLLRILIWTFIATALLFCTLQLLLRFVLLPQIDIYRGDIERALSQAVHHPVVIGKLSGRMQGIRPRLELDGLSIKDDAGRNALSLNNVTAIVGWSSLLKLSPHLHLLQIDAPVLDVRRDAAGRFFVAGMPIKEEQGGPDFSAWVLDQGRVVIRDARVVWTDEKRNAPPLVLDRLNLRLQRAVVGHRFGLTAQPPAALAGPIDLRGDFTGNSIERIREWEGELYAKAGNVDLAGWRAWVDYPVEVDQGRGSATVWLDFAGLQPTSLTADIAFDNVKTTLGTDLEALDMQRLAGRVTARKLDSAKNGYEITTRQLTLSAKGIAVPATDLRFTRDDGGGDILVNRLDFPTLAALAAHLPLPPDLRRQIADYAPQGSLKQFHGRWRGERWPFTQYAISGGIDRLGIASVNGQPGFSGVTGTIDGDQDNGTVVIAARDTTLTLPKVFTHAMAFAALDARMQWKRAAHHTDLQFSQVKFHNADAEGSASGSYRTSATGAGSIDLDARLTRADGKAVWHYIPLQAGADTASFLERALLQATASDVTLKLKGDLDKFPFADRSGTFRIQGRFRDGVLRYAEDWPQIDNIAGTLDFDGPAMTIAAQEARIMGVRAAPTKAVIADLEHAQSLLVEGKAAGATTDFLKFIEASPVGAEINHATRDMKASGNGELDLKLALSLHRLADSTVAGSYRFDNNGLLLEPAMPALEGVRGKLEFTAKSLRAKGVTATMLSMPLRFDMKTEDDGAIVADVVGDLNAAQLQQRLAHAGLRNLSGTARWTGRVAVRDRSTEIRISSDLVGLASSLPAPFNKTTRDALPLRVEYKPADLRLLSRKQRDGSARQVAEATLGRAASPVLRAQLIYREDADTRRSVFERGLVGIGDMEPRLPDRGVAIAVVQPRVDLDLWQKLLDDGAEDKPAASASKSLPTDDLLPSRLDLRTAELRTLGRTFHDVRFVASRRVTLQSGQQPTLQAPIWGVDVNSREVIAKLEWAGDTGNGARLSGRVARFGLPDAVGTDEKPAEVLDQVSAETIKKLPNLDLTFDHLMLKGRDYGELKLMADNKGSDWNARFNVRNDDGTLEGQGVWRLPPAVPSSQTRTEFKLHAASIERFLNRVGYPNTVRRGNADLTGKLAWAGGPQDFELAAANGELVLDARSGQFSKLEPGVGRLLGILSLQSIPRRITLDFRDIFSEGFAFDSISGKVAVNKGVLDTQGMDIRGPAAKVQMAGSVNIEAETQDLKVRVQPTFSDSAAVGALFVHPAVGAGAWVFNKLFGNPLDNAFAYDYTVTGSWADPKVEKVGAQHGSAAAAAAKEESE